MFNPDPTKEQAPAQETDALTTKLQAIVNEQGEQKYANVETALDALKSSQEFIPSLKSKVNEQEQEIATLREQMAKQQGVQEALEKFAAQPNAQPETQEETPTEQIGKEDIESLVQNLFKAQAQTTKSDENFKSVQNALASKYGERASEHIANKAKELSTTTEYLEDMARNNPTMALQLLDAPKVGGTSMSYGGTNTTNFSQVKDEPLSAPAESLLAGANPKDVQDFMGKIRADVYKKHGITE